MFSHITHGTNNMERARAFYDPVLATLGISCFWTEGEYAGYGEHRGTEFWLLPPFDGEAPTVGNGQMTAFLAPDRTAVDAFYSAALPGAAMRAHLAPVRSIRSSYCRCVRDPMATSFAASVMRQLDR